MNKRYCQSLKSEVTDLDISSRPMNDQVINVPQNVVYFNVGGKLYTVLRSTIEKNPETMLAKLISDNWNENDLDRHSIYIDRDGERFQYILDWYRDGFTSYLADSTEHKEAMNREFQYYGITNVELNIRVDYEKLYSRLDSYEYYFLQRMKDLNVESTFKNKWCSSPSIAIRFLLNRKLITKIGSKEFVIQLGIVHESQMQYADFFMVSIGEIFLRDIVLSGIFNGSIAFKLIKNVEDNINSEYSIHFKW